MATEPLSSPSLGQRGQLGRYVLLCGAMLVFAACLVLGFNQAALQHEAALRDAGANLRVAFLADYEMQRLTDEPVTRTSGEAADPVPGMIEGLTVGGTATRA